MQGTQEKKNPRDGASVLSIIFLWWIQDVLRLGNKRPLTDKDLLPLLEDYKAKVLIEKAEKHWMNELKRSQLKNRKPRLWKALIRLIPWRSRLAIIVLKSLWSLSFVFLPLCLWLVLKTLNDRSSMDMKLASVYVALLGVTSVVKAVSTQHCDYLTELWGLKLKVAVIGLIYKKVLSLNRYGLEAKLSGNIINLVSNDAQKVEKSLNQLGMVLSVPLELTISLVILWYLIGWEAFIGAAFFFILVTFQILMARKAAKLRQKAAVFTDKRLAVMNEIISGIRAVKMYAWEWNFRDVLYELRRKEMAVINLKGIIISTLVVLFYTTLPIAALISVTALALTGVQLSSFVIFTLLIGLVTIRFTFCVNLSTSFYMVTDAKVALDRIQAFLKDQDANFEGTAKHSEKVQLLTEQSGNIDDNLAVHYKNTKKIAKYRTEDVSADEHYETLVSISEDVLKRNGKIPSNKLCKAPLEACIDEASAILTSSNQTRDLHNKEPFLSISDASCSWNQRYLTNTLCGITLHARKGEMVAITGAVGSGKSSLLTAILRELPLLHGEVSYHGKVGYVPQIPWVFSGTVRDNILFGLPFNEDRFEHVVHVCGLTKDLSDFTNGDLTEIGQRGVTLSGGQKARVGLARAVYSDADIYLLDDPLSAVDTKVGSKLFESCILGELSGRIRLLATHQLQYLKNVDHIAVMEKGTIVCQGGYDELKEKGAFFGIVELTEAFEDEPGRAECVSVEGNIEEFLPGFSVSLVPSDKGQVDQDDKESQEGFEDLKESEGPGMFSRIEGSEKGTTEKVQGGLSIPLVSKEQDNDSLSGHSELKKSSRIHQEEKEEPYDSKVSELPQVSSEKGNDKEPFLGHSDLEESSLACHGGQEEPTNFKTPELISSDEPREKEKIDKIPSEPSMSKLSSEKGNDKESLSGISELIKNSVICQNGLEESDSPELTRLDELTEKGSVEKVPCRLSISSVVDDLELAELQEDDIMSLENVGLIPKNIQEPDQRPVVDLKESEEHKSTGTVTWRLYWKYFKQGLPVHLISLLLALLIFTQVSLLAPNWWLAKMAVMSREDQMAPITQVIHASVVAVAIVAMAISSFLFYHLLLKAAEKLHNKMSTTIIKAPVLFFDTNPAGRLLNRFSKDVGSMDDVLPPLFLSALKLCLSSFCAILVPAATNYWLFLALLPIIGIYVYFGRYFLKSSRELKRIEAIRCSPVYSHITETVNGLEIVHSSNMNKTFLDRLQRYQDDNTQAFFMVVSCNRWLAVRLDLLSSAFVTIVAVGVILITENPAYFSVVLFIMLNMVALTFESVIIQMKAIEQYFPVVLSYYVLQALAGLALTYALQTLDSTQYGVRLASEVENLMTSVERVMAYTEIEPEPGYSTETRPSVPWPNAGSLTVQNLSLVYFKGGPRVLQDISFCVCSKEKVGVVGRTGAGKSSLVSALFRMPEPLGKVIIDGVDIASINLQEARRSMAVITQDPVLFGGSLKRNMDPFSQYTDQDLWTALEEVQLKTLVEGLPGQLDFKLRESGTNLSVGERQLVCLARALVQKNKVIIMDEATANVDFKTDRLIQEVIRHKFKDSTVLTIAHRLNTIMDYDKVLVLDGGRVVEFDKPEVLMRNGGVFAELVRSHNRSVEH